MPVTVLDDVAVVDVLAGRTLPRQQVVVDGDRIADGPACAGTPAEPGAETRRTSAAVRCCPA